MLGIERGFVERYRRDIRGESTAGFKILPAILAPERNAQSVLQSKYRANISEQFPYPEFIAEANPPPCLQLHVACTELPQTPQYTR